MNPNDKIIQNLLVAQAMIQDLPDTAFIRGLYDYANEELMEDPHQCGAAGCFGGWVAVHPYFKKLGVTRSCCGSPMLPDEDDAFHVSEELFGDAGMFAPTRMLGFPEKREVLLRIRDALEAAFNRAD